MDKKVQQFDKDIIITSIVSPDMKTNVMIVSPNEFHQYEVNSIYTDYCMLIDDKIYISSKVMYNYVVVNGISKEQYENKLKQQSI